MNEQLQAYLQDLLAQAHGEATLTKLPEPLQEKMVTDLYLQLEERLNEFLFRSLPDTHHDAYFDLVETNPPTEHVIIFLEGHIPDIREKMSQVLELFADDYVGWIAART